MMSDAPGSVKYFFSYHPNIKDLFNRKKYAWGWKVYRGSMQDLVRASSKCAWSPIIWAEGHRLIKNFKGTQWGALDFDGTHNIQDLAQAFSDTISIIGTTKSHSPESHHFRVIFLWDRPITDKAEYKHNLVQLTKNYDVDPCFDAGRLFWPCKEIYQIITDGIKQPVLAKPENYTYADTEEMSPLQVAYHRQRGTVPCWIKKLIVEGAPVGHRHRKCYAIGATLFQLGYSVDQITEVVMKSPLAAIGESDVRRQIWWGAKRISDHKSGGGAGQHADERAVLSDN